MNIFSVLEHRRSRPVARRFSDRFSKLWLALCCSVILSACGGSGSSSSAAPATSPPTPAPEMGELLVGITDAEGDFVRYVVDVNQLTLMRANGDQVDVLPLSTRIDFTELTEVTDFLTLATVPAGVYETVTVTLDFTDADIQVQDSTGAALAAVAVDEDGVPLGVTEVRLSLASSDVITVAPGRPAAFSLDFDLDASNEIDLEVSPVQVIVSPFLLAVPELEMDRAHRARGLLAGVDATASQFGLKVRPGRHRGGDFGLIRLHVDAQTQYEIDGTGYTGQAGLDAMALLAQDTPVLAGVSIGAQADVVESGLQAETVLAGTSVPWADSNVLKGTVIARDGDVLTVSGATLDFTDGTQVFRGEHQLIVGAETSVSALGRDNADLNSNSLSVGQRLVAFGEVVDDETFTANPGRVRMLVSALTAEVVASDPLVVDLHYVNGRRLAQFDFAGTGATVDQDADPEAYEVDTGVLVLPDVVAEDLVRIRGYANAFGMAAPDFLAQTVIDVATDMRAASLGVVWPEGSSEPFLSMSPARLALDLSESREILKQRGVPHSVSNPLAAITLIAPDAGQGAYAVGLRGDPELHLYRSFEEMVSELTRQLQAGNRLHHIAAHGRYNAAADEFTTGRAVFVFRPSSAE